MARRETCADIRCASNGRSAVALWLKAKRFALRRQMVAAPLQWAGQRSGPPMSLPWRDGADAGRGRGAAAGGAAAVVMFGSQGLSVATAADCR